MYYLSQTKQGSKNSTAIYLFVAVNENLCDEEIF